MASSNKTTYLRLNQWIASDPVLRTDFNSDNNKLDGEVNKRSLNRLYGRKVSTASGSITLDLTDYTITDYVELQLYLYPLTSAESVTTLQINQETGVALAAMAPDGSRGLIIHMYLLPGGVWGEWTSPGLGESGTFRFPGLAPGDLASLTLTCGGSATYQSGTNYRLYALKI